MHMPVTAYQRLEERFRRIAILHDVDSLLHWDMSTMMPPGGASGRSEQMAAIKVLCHEWLTAPEIEEWIEAAQSETALDSWQAANLAEMRRAWLHASAVDAKLTEALAKAVSDCEMTWRAARAAADFESVRPSLQIVLDLIRETARAKAEKLGVSAYDALLDGFEPGLRAAEVDRMFAPLIARLPEFLGQVLDHQKRTAPISLDGPFPIEQQRILAVKFMGKLGFDFDRGRLDVSLHPFCGGAFADVRITTRYDENNFARALMGVLHETGHALYEQGLPFSWRYQPVGRVHSMALHESQSLLIEMQACRSREFIEFAAPLMAEAFGGVGPAWNADNLYRHYTRVSRGAIRVDADEVTYPLHVLLRYRLEKALLAGDLTLADLPDAWNRGMKDLLGVTPADDAEGCLQDIHWYDGAWGYFPSYTLGAMAAAQLFDAARAADPGIAPAIGRGDFTPLVSWLRRQVHGEASRLAPADLIHQATGRPLDPNVFLNHLERRYLA
jgi:carboxypeptidase Taq